MEYISLIQTNGPQDNQAVKTSSGTVDITLEDFYKYIPVSNDELEGVWTSPYYKVGIKKASNEYHGFHRHGTLFI